MTRGILSIEFASSGAFKVKIGEEVNIVRSTKHDAGRFYALVVFFRIESSF